MENKYQEAAKIRIDQIIENLIRWSQPDRTWYFSHTLDDLEKLCDEGRTEIEAMKRDYELVPEYVLAAINKLNDTMYAIALKRNSPAWAARFAKKIGM